MTSSRTARFALKLLTIACSGVLLTACGGSGGGSSSSASTPGTPGVIDSLSKTSIWYGPDAREGEAMAACTGCSDTNFSYRWVVDVNRDGQFDENPNSADVTIQGPKFEINAQTVARSVKLIASHPEAAAEAFKIYTPDASQVVQTINIKQDIGIAVQQDGTMVAFGNPSMINNLNRIKNELTGVQNIFSVVLAGKLALIALKKGGSAVLLDREGNLITGQNDLKTALKSDVQSVIGAPKFIVVLKNDDSAVLLDREGNLITGQNDLKAALKSEVQSVIKTFYFIVVLKKDDSAVLFDHEGNLITGQNDLKAALKSEVQSVIHLLNFIVVLKNDDSAVLFDFRGTPIADSDLKAALKSEVQSVIYLLNFIVVLKNDDSAVLLDHKGNLITDSDLQKALKSDVQSVIGAPKFIVVLKNDGSKVLFNDGGERITEEFELNVNEKLFNVVGHNGGFLIKKDGSFVSERIFSSDNAIVFDSRREQAKLLNTN